MHRPIGLYMFIVAMGLGAYLTVRYGVNWIGSELHEGDRLEARRCRMCLGSGKDRKLSEDYPVLGNCCPFCAGSGTVQVILPGPKRPTRVWGAVLARDLAGDMIEYEDPRNLKRIGPQTALLPPKGTMIPGGIAAARVDFRGEGGEVAEIKTDKTGRFSKRLAPGSYKVKVTAPGFEALEDEIEVEPLTEPIWLEKARLVRLPESSAEARSMYGLHLVAALGRRGEKGFLRLSPGSP